MSDERLREQFERVITSERFWRQPATKFNPIDAPNAGEGGESE